MAQGLAGEIIAVVALLGVLAFTLLKPRRLPEALAAVPAAGLMLALGLVTPTAAGRRAMELLPTLAFLAAILVLAHLADREGVFSWLGSRLAKAGGDNPRRLLLFTFVAASVTTAVLSLDATVVLLTPVVFATVVELALPPKPHVYACAHLANSASTLLPVSNLTNLLAFATTGLSFAAFTGLMALPWFVAIGVELLVFLRFFRADLAGSASVAQRPQARAAPKFALAVLAAVLAGFAVCAAFDLAPAFAAGAGAVALATRGLLRRTVGIRTVLAEISPAFLLFVIALAIVVQAVAEHGLGALLASVLPRTATLAALLGVAVLAAVLANLVNNLPATLVLLAALGPHPHAGIVLAMLLGVNLGPNASYVGSLATLLWRRVVVGRSIDTTLREFLRLGARAVPSSLLLAVLALWGALQLAGLAR